MSKGNKDKKYVKKSAAAGSLPDGSKPVKRPLPTPSHTHGRTRCDVCSEIAKVKKTETLPYPPDSKTGRLREQVVRYMECVGKHKHRFKRVELRYADEPAAPDADNVENKTKSSRVGKVKSLAE